MKEITGLYARVGKENKDIVELTEKELRDWLEGKDREYIIRLVDVLLENVRGWYEACIDCREQLKDAYINGVIDAMYEEDLEV